MVRTGMIRNERPSSSPSSSNHYSSTIVQEAREAALRVSNELHTLNAYHHVIETKKRRKYCKYTEATRSIYSPSSPSRRAEKKENESQSVDNKSHIHAMDRGFERGRSEEGDRFLNEEKKNEDRDADAMTENVKQSNLLVPMEMNHLRMNSAIESEGESRSINVESLSPNNTITTANNQTTSNRPKKGWRSKIRQPIKRKKGKLKQKDYSQFFSDDPTILYSKSKKATKGASMCSFCGSIFSNQYYAAHHEKFCISRGIRSMKEVVVAGMKAKTNLEDESQIDTNVPRKGQINLSVGMRRLIIIPDDALINVTRKSKAIITSHEQLNAERELALMARDRSFYDMKAIRSLELQMYHTKQVKHRNGNKLWNTLQDRLAETYDLIKDGDHHHNENVDKYKVRKPDGEMKLDDDTLYVNVFVKQSAKFINNELDRLFQKRWMINGEREHKNNFELLRHAAQVQALRFAKFSLSADVQPEKIAVQLSNDLCRLVKILSPIVFVCLLYDKIKSHEEVLNRLLSPQLKSFGVEIETAIEYRKGPFFLLGVNIITIDWIILLKHFYDDVSQRKNDWSLLMSVRSISIDDIEKEEEIEVAKWKFVLNSLFRMTRLEILEQLLAWVYHLSWVVSVPLCAFLYRYFLKGTVHKLIVTAVTDDFFKYVEQKGMEMDVQVKHAKHQMGFMLEVLHQMRKDENILKKRKTEVEEGESAVELRGPLLGPLNEYDDKEATNVPDDLSAPINLEHVVFDSELPVGYRRLRKALLLNSDFIEEALFTDALNYSQIKSDAWDKHDGLIGETVTPEEVNEDDFVGAKKNTEYLMPSSVFVKANMAYEETNLDAYNDHFFTVKRKTVNPDVPYGRTFCAWTQITVYNLGNNNSRMVCSVEAEFPNGPPMVARSIKSAMRQGVSDMFLELGKVICKYASVTE